MSMTRITLFALATSAVAVTTLGQAQSKVPNPITGEGLPNPAPKVTRNWGELPAGRKWGKIGRASCRERVSECV